MQLLIYFWEMLSQEVDDHHHRKWEAAIHEAAAAESKRKRLILWEKIIQSSQVLAFVLLLNVRNIHSFLSLVLTTTKPH